MNHRNKKFSYSSEIIPFGLIVLMLALSLYFFSVFPDQVPTHWDAAGNVNGYSGKAGAAFFVPILAIIIYVVLLALPSFDPKRNQYQHFEKAYHTIKSGTIAFLLLIYIVVGLNGIGVRLPISQVILSAVGLFFVLIGAVLPSLKQNWFFGIRTPWTLSSKAVWEKTHFLGGRLFVLAGFVLMAASLLGKTLLLPAIIGAIAIAAVIPLIYSYILFRREK